MEIGRLALPEDDSVAFSDTASSDRPNKVDNRLGVVVADLTRRTEGALDVNAGVNDS